ncbi:MAG TPA: SLC13/DASS family transporter [Chlorobaculum parvum]|uniref:SLC13/DASS family transporter n=1 Tax=Chlorobaculum parvum TaxID=274539 RepID=A0A7C5DFT8_9CHLB|nr:SLC13/DASS family transporter [Chlorobaculum parvum]
MKPGLQSYRLFGALAGPLISFLCIVFPATASLGESESIMAGVALWMAIWWVLEVVPLGVTALLPVALFPLFGLMNGKTVSSIYFNHIIMLFIGGFLIALAMQRWNLHKRIALKILSLAGSNPAVVLLGFMLSTAFLSMWISNTATTMMMMPIGLSVIMRLEAESGPNAVRRYSVGLLLGIAYSASIGGVATLVGTPPNLSCARIFSIMFPEAPEISFATWFLFGFPLSLTFMLLVWGVLALLFRPSAGTVRMKGGGFREAYHALGRMGREEVVVLIAFASLALLWLTRSGLDIGELHLPGWSSLFANPGFINDGTVAMTVALVLFLVPAREGSRVLDWETAKRLPWDIVLLFGGGFALASGFRESGLAEALGHQLEGLSALHPLLIVVCICIFVTFLTELTSNTATAEMLLPILAALALALEINPLLLMIPATLSCSFAFMLPVATPPNAIVFGSNRIAIPDMARVGIWFNLLGVLLITASLYTIGLQVFGIDIFTMPDWAVPASGAR